MVLWKTGVTFSTPIHPISLYEESAMSFLRGDYIDVFCLFLGFLFAKPYLGEVKSHSV